ncbi:ribosome biogenesis GTP-binding protein YihA/YsxC [Inhella gelatinilytica]|uniref:Probable GTP-binding protein EngB n=1 Tax=Inhella gelatinilytica TaxID=2795030 RepID=A0A931NCG2_9BURK|nr:ribosome biogenesis GTP-binding protein YihA/YsxC [Inhella gelatinilytica]MBH9551240.1 YihA family ribosome biogenesis GTP-binding protein [Inhella gelatinilytica]
MTVPHLPPPQPADMALDVTDKTVLGWAHTARFFTTAAQLHQVPETGLPEVAFVGRSNAGKSTAINTLAQHKRLAFASKTPGRTQHINLFHVGPKEVPNQIWADLPGYGYAAVNRDAKSRWQKVMADYLQQREPLRGVVQMVDSRHGLTDLDRQLIDFVAERVYAGEVKLLVLLTKADKLSRKEQAAILEQTQELLGSYVLTEQADIGVALFSALKGQGVADAARCLYEWAQEPLPALPSADEAPDSGSSEE